MIRYTHSRGPSGVLGGLNSYYLEKPNAIRRNVGAFESWIGFGVRTGTAVAGGIGCEARVEYTPVENAANVASRAEVQMNGRSRPVEVVEAMERQPVPSEEEK